VIGSLTTYRADDPAGAFPVSVPSLEEMIRQAREFVAAEVPFGSLAGALDSDDPADPAAELELIMRELFTLEEQTARAADMIERSARELPGLADLLNAGLRRPVLDVLTSYLDGRAKTGLLRQTPDTAATARLVLETLTWFARPSPGRSSCCRWAPSCCWPGRRRPTA
jgi:hypothetical protein